MTRFGLLTTFDYASIVLIIGLTLGTATAAIVHGRRRLRNKSGDDSRRCLLWSGCFVAMLVLIVLVARNQTTSIEVGNGRVVINGFASSQTVDVRRIDQVELVHRSVGRRGRRSWASKRAFLKLTLDDATIVYVNLGRPSTIDDRQNEKIEAAVKTEMARRLP